MLDDRSYMRSSEYRPRWSATAILMVACTAAFVVQNIVEYYFRSFPLAGYLALSLHGLEHGYVWQLFTFQFLHAGLFHLICNLITIYFFGNAMEDALGAKRMLQLYFSSGVLGGLVHVLGAFLAVERFGGAVIGASAGAFGLVAAFATMFPDRLLQLLVFFVIPITLRARTLLLISFLLAGLGIIVPTDNVAHLAHLGGIFTGILFVRWIVQSERSLAMWQPFRRQPRPRELVSTRSFNSDALHRPKAEPPEELPPAEFISREVDPILDKISAHGIHSLTDGERKTLEAARKKMSKR